MTQASRCPVVSAPRWSRATARPAYQPSCGAGLHRAAAAGSGNPGGSRLLGGRILSFGLLSDSWQIQQVQSLADAFTLPTFDEWQRQILTVAFSKIGMPYIWGGTSDTTEVDFGVAARGGYDCSGFVWRVYKLQSYANEGNLASTIQARTTYTMSVEVPASKRISFKTCNPADVIFFGTKGPSSQRSSGLPHRDLRRQRLVHPVVGRRRRTCAAQRLEPQQVRLGPPAVARSRARLAPDRRSAPVLPHSSERATSIG